MTAQVGPCRPVMNTLLDAGYPTGRSTTGSRASHGLPDALIDAAVQRFAVVPSSMTIFCSSTSTARLPGCPTATAVPHREYPAGTCSTPSVWTRPGGHRRRTSAGHGRPTLRPVAPTSLARRWLNYLGDDQANDAVQAAHGPNYDRLREIKRRLRPPSQRLPSQPQHRTLGRLGGGASGSRPGPVRLRRVRRSCQQ